jgi:hypothetical protein
MRIPPRPSGTEHCTPLVRVDVDRLDISGTDHSLPLFIRSPLRVSEQGSTHVVRCPALAQAVVLSNGTNAPGLVSRFARNHLNFKIRYWNEERLRGTHIRLRSVAGRE